MKIVTFIKKVLSVGLLHAVSAARFNQSIAARFFFKNNPDVLRFLKLNSEKIK